MTIYLNELILFKNQISEHKDIERYLKMYFAVFKDIF